jgi:molybdenum cofactor cytidylyltransferase
MDQPILNSDIYACVLAAGKSSRFGATKLAQSFRGKPLVQYALTAAREACEGRVLLVVGHDHESVVEASEGLFDKLVVNTQFGEGISTSVSASVRACENDADAIIIILADQPLISAAHIMNVIDTWSGADNEIVATSFDGTACPPMLFPKDAFSALSQLSGDHGAKSLLANEQFVVTCIDFPPARFDIDRPPDLHRVDQD